MTREDMKEIICRVIESIEQDDNQTPEAACIFSDGPTCPSDTCDVIMRYGIPNPR